MIDVQKKQSKVFSDANLYGFINIYIFGELYFYFNKNSECLINRGMIWIKKTIERMIGLSDSILWIIYMTEQYCAIE